MGGNTSKQEAEVIVETYSKFMNNFVTQNESKSTSATSQTQKNVIKLDSVSNCKITQTPVLSQSVTNRKQTLSKMNASTATGMLSDIVQNLQSNQNLKNTGINLLQGNAANTITKNKTKIANTVANSLKNILKSHDVNSTSQAQTNLIQIGVCKDSEILNNPVAYQKVLNQQVLQNTMDALTSANITTKADTKTVMDTALANSNTLADLLFGGGPFQGVFMVIVLCVVAFFAFKLIQARTGGGGGKMGKLG